MHIAISYEDPSKLLSSSSEQISPGKVQLNILEKMSVDMEL